MVSGRWPEGRSQMTSLSGPQLFHGLSLGVHAEAPPLAKARAPPAQLGFEPPVDDPGIDPSWPDSFDSHPEY